MFSALGETLRFSAVIRDQDGRVMTGSAVEWSSAASTVVTVDSRGNVTSVGNGTTKVSARSGAVSGSATVTVSQTVTSVVLEPQADTLLLGETVRLVAEVLDANGHSVEGARFTWSSSHPEVAPVDASGRVSGIGEGRALITLALGDVRRTSEIRVHNRDRRALVALYETMDGHSWANNTNWLTDSAIADWYGVVVEDGRVTGLAMNANGLSGSIPVEVGDLANLTHLYFFDNVLSGAIPPELGDLVHLTELRAEGNNLSGGIPPELGDLASLKVLYLFDNGLSGSIPVELGDLANLAHLYLFGNALSGGIPPELGNLDRLEVLYLFDNALSGAIPPELGNLAHLTELRAHGNNLSGRIPRELGNLTSLEFLHLDSNSLSGAIPLELVNLVNLESLNLDNNSDMLCSPNDSRLLEFLARHGVQVPLCSDSDEIFGPHRWPDTAEYGGR